METLTFEQISLIPSFTMNIYESLSLIFLPYFAGFNWQDVVETSWYINHYEYLKAEHVLNSDSSLEIKLSLQHCVQMSGCFITLESSECSIELKASRILVVRFQHLKFIWIVSHILIKDQHLTFEYSVCLFFYILVPKRFHSLLSLFLIYFLVLFYS